MSLKTPEIEIINRIKQVRAELNMTQQGFADLLGISRSYLKDIELGKPPSFNFIISLITTTNYSSDWILKGEENVSKAVNKEPIAEWVVEWLENADEKNRIWLEIQMKRCFPEFEQWEKLKHQKMRN